MNEHLQQAIVDIRTERERQKRDFSDESDAKNTASDWVAAVTHYIGRAVTLPWDPAFFRKSMVQVGALALAAIEWHDRVNGKMPPRHFEAKRDCLRFATGGIKCRPRFLR